MEAGKLDEGQVGTAEGEVGRVNIDTLRTLQGDTQSWKELGVAGVGNIHSARGNIRGRREEAVARVVQEAWASTGAGDVDTDRIRLSKSHAHTLVRSRSAHGLSSLGKSHARNPR